AERDACQSLAASADCPETCRPSTHYKGTEGNRSLPAHPTAGAQAMRQGCALAVLAVGSLGKALTAGVGWFVATQPSTSMTAHRPAPAIISISVYTVVGNGMPSGLAPALLIPGTSSTPNVLSRSQASPIV